MNIIKNAIQTIILSVVVLLSAYVVMAAWAEPTVAPTGGNASAPLDVSATGQTKAGGLILNTGGAANGLIVSAGKVGIGTAGPNALTHIYAGASTVGTPISGTNLNIESNSSNYLSLLGPEAAIQGLVIGIPGQNTDTWIRRRGDQTNNPLEFGAGASARMAILDNGNIGIGTVSPNTTLDVNGAFTATGNLTLGGSATGASQPFVSVYRNGAQGVTTGVNVDIVFNTSIASQAGLTWTGSATIPSAGVYTVSCAVQWTGGNNTKIRRICINITGAISPCQETMGHADGNNQSVTDTFKLIAGDTVACTVFNPVGSSGDIAGGTATRGSIIKNW